MRDAWAYLRFRNVGQPLSLGSIRRDAIVTVNAHLPVVRYEQQPGVGLAVRKYVLWRRGVLKSDAQRKPGPRVSRETAAEVDFMLERIERAPASRPVPCRFVRGAI